MAANPNLVSVVAKLDQARIHIGALNDAVDRFNKSAGKGGGRFNDETREYIFTFRDMPQPEPEIAVIVGDIVHNLHSALDHLAFQLVENPTVEPLGVVKRPKEKRWFPIEINPPAYDDAGVIGADPLARTTIKGLQPFRNKTHPLWLIREMSRRDKHRLLVVIAHELSEIGINESLFEPGTLLKRKPGPFKGGAEVVRGTLKPSLNPSHPTMNMRLHFGFGMRITTPDSGDRDLVWIAEDMLHCSMSIVSTLSGYVAG